MTVVWPTTSLTRTVINELTATGHEQTVVKQESSRSTFKQRMP
jgi:hypothetical protein